MNFSFAWLVIPSHYANDYILCSKTALEKNAEINIFGKLSETD